MNTHFRANITAGLGLAALVLLSSCAGRNYVSVDHRAYEKTPDELSSKVWRGIAKSNPLTAKAAFHGNWGGSGNHGGAPVDLMDEGFRRHDLVYYESTCGSQFRAADRALVDWLEEIDEDSLDEKQRKYRERAIGFMSSPIANFVGKPPLVMFRGAEREACYFQSPDVVVAFFEPSHDGFPYEDPPVEPKAVPVETTAGTGPLFAGVTPEP